MTMIARGRFRGISLNTVEMLSAENLLSVYIGTTAFSNVSGLKTKLSLHN